MRFYWALPRRIQILIDRPIQYLVSTPSILTNPSLRRSLDTAITALKSLRFEQNILSHLINNMHVIHTKYIGSIPSYVSIPLFTLKNISQNFFQGYF